VECTFDSYLVSEKNRRVKQFVFYTEMCSTQSVVSGFLLTRFKFSIPLYNIDPICFVAVIAQCYIFVVLWRINLLSLPCLCVKVLDITADSPKLACFP